MEGTTRLPSLTDLLTSDQLARYQVMARLIDGTNSAPLKTTRFNMAELLAACDWIMNDPGNVDPLDAVRDVLAGDIDDYGTADAGKLVRLAVLTGLAVKHEGGHAVAIERRDDE